MSFLYFVLTGNMNMMYQVMFHELRIILLCTVIVFFFNNWIWTEIHVESNLKRKSPRHAELIMPTIEKLTSSLLVSGNRFLDLIVNE